MDVSIITPPAWDLGPVDLAGFFQHRIRHHPTALVVAAKEAALAPGVAGNSLRLLDADEERVAVAVQPHLAYPLHVPGLLALAPQTPAGTRPVVSFPGLNGERERLSVHPGKHQNATCPDVLSDDRHRSLT